MRPFLKTFFIATVVVVAVSGVAVAGTVWYLLRDLPSISGLHEYQPSLVTRVYSADKQVIGQFFVERRILVPIEKIPKALVNAVIATEDSRFFEHRGIDFVGIGRAMLTNILSGRIRQGASTITQQLARSLFLSPHRDFERKVREALLALKIEQMLGKEQILELYLNQIYFGHGAYGVQSAAQTYFNKDVGQLTLPESAFLAGLPKAPSDYSPYNHQQAAKRRQSLVLKRMTEQGFITPKQAEQAIAQALAFRPLVRDDLAPYFVERVRQRLVAEYGETMVYKGGLQVYTTLSRSAQVAANTALQEGLRQLDKRQGYRGPLRRAPTGDNPLEIRVGTIGAGSLREGDILEGVVTKITRDGVIVSTQGVVGKIAVDDLAWARRQARATDTAKITESTKSPGDMFKIGDVVEVGVKKVASPVSHFSLEQTPQVEGALLSLDPRTGRIVAMVGGYDFKRSEYNRTVLSRRQPGSAFKPIIYATAVDKGLSPGTPLVDSGVVYNENDPDMVWRPENYDKKFYGQILMRDALAHSRNAATVRLLEKIGVSSVVDLAQKVGIASALAHDLTLALGSSGVTVQELTAAYGVFLNQGMRLEPYLIESVVDASGKSLENHLAEPREVVSKETAYLITNMMEDVIQRGTAVAARGMGRPLAGKTGTTNDFTDAWFIGGAPNLVTGVWVGFDDIRSIGEKETGSHAALPIWMSYMKAALEPLPVIPFMIPEGIVYAKIDPATGLLAADDSTTSVVEVYVKGTEPTQQAAEKASPSDFFKFDKL
ncbi:MAG TPA: PBP1A family penicillin-binding protein [Nitrospirales bacterium]